MWDLMDHLAVVPGASSRIGYEFGALTTKVRFDHRG